MTRHRYLLVFLLSMLALTAPAVHSQAPPDLLFGERCWPHCAAPAYKSGFERPQPRSQWCAAPFFMGADRVIFDTPNARIIAAGNVELYFNDYILTSDQVIYDRTTNKLIAEPNAALKDPNGAITRADRLEVTKDLRDAFVASVRQDNEGPGRCQ